MNARQARMLAAGALLAFQAGDRPGEAQPPLPAGLEVPAAPAHSAEEQRASFVLAAGLHLELAAAEPLVADPVAARFDADGRLWVVEMRGYMPDIEGRGELERNGVIAVLADTDGDRVMDRRQVFLDGLVLPRAVLPIRDGALVLAPPELLFARDRDGDGRADEREVVDRGFEAGWHNPEHAANGLLPALNNWIACANHDQRYRWRNGTWEKQRTAGGGQWGIAQDDLGRLYFNGNSDPLRAALIDAHAAARNLHYGAAEGANEQLAADFRVWPARVTPGVNRGYQPNFLADGKLREFTAACAPLVYREHALPPAYWGGAFVCEPAANLVKFFVLEETAAGVTARNGAEGREFLASRDERFRPVNLCTGPDGALYVIDMYRGVIQHRNFVTSFLRAQVEQRALERPIGLGRIWRVTGAPAPAPAAAPAPPRARSAPEQIALLDHADGWWRDAAQQELIAAGAAALDLGALRAGARAFRPLGRIHALWTLEGLGALEPDIVRAALAAGDERVVRAAMAAGEALLRAGEVDLLAAYLEAARSPCTRRQCALSLGACPLPAGLAALAQLLAADAADPRVRAAALSSVYGREREFLDLILSWSEPRPGRAELLAALARCVAVEGNGARLAGLLERLAAETVDWRAAALRRGLLEGRPKGPDGRPSFLPLPQRPEGFARLPQELQACLLWPGRDDVVVAAAAPLTAEEEQRFARGRSAYAQDCAACHQASGLGEPGKAPPLRWSEWVLGSEEDLIRILLHGLNGPIQVGGSSWNMEMPAYAGDDARIAEVLTYIRREWGHGATAVAPAQAAAVRAATRERRLPWTVSELPGPR